MNKSNSRMKRLILQKLLGFALLVATVITILIGSKTDLFEDGGAEIFFFTIPMGIGLLVTNEVFWD